MRKLSRAVYRDDFAAIFGLPYTFCRGLVVRVLFLWSDFFVFLLNLYFAISASFVRLVKRKKNLAVSRPSAQYDERRLGIIDVVRSLQRCYIVRIVRFMRCCIASRVLPSDGRRGSAAYFPIDKISLCLQRHFYVGGKFSILCGSRVKIFICFETKQKS